MMGKNVFVVPEVKPNKRWKKVLRFCLGDDYQTRHKLHLLAPLHMTLPDPKSAFERIPGSWDHMTFVVEKLADHYVLVVTVDLRVHWTRRGEYKMVNGIMEHRGVRIIEPVLMHHRNVVANAYTVSEFFAETEVERAALSLIGPKHEKAIEAVREFSKYKECGVAMTPKLLALFTKSELLANG